MAHESTDLVARLIPQLAALAQPLHEVALRHDCRYRIDEGEGETTIVYSAAHFRIHITGQALSFEGQYDIRSFLKLYRETESRTVKELLFHATEVCRYCITDKCTTFLMAKQRTIELDGHSKKPCSWVRHQLRIDVTAETLPACLVIAEMMFAYMYPALHSDLSVDNQVTYAFAQKDSFYIVGYMQRHSQISPSDEDFISSLLQVRGDGRRKIDDLLQALGQVDRGQYVGATDNFINGVLYDFIFGIVTDQRPATVPEGAICRKVRDGEWAVYNSSTGDYKSIWRHYTTGFYAAEHKGFDRARIPFEYYDAGGKFYDVHIPVDADMPSDSGRVITLQHLPNALVAGFLNYCESDHPLYRARPFDTADRVRALFPLSNMVVKGWIHSLFGKPMRDFQGVIVDDYTVIPEGLDLVEMKGGLWRLSGRRHFNGGGEDDWPFDVGLDSRVSLDDCQHPRSFNVYDYRARGGYTEIGVPMRVRGELTYTEIELPPQRVIGRLEAPPDSVVTDEEMERFYTLPENKERGSYIIAYTTVTIPKVGPFYDKPLIKGVLADADTPVPAGLTEFWLTGGKYIRVTEDIPNCTPGWEIEYLPESAEREAGHKLDLKGQFVVKQNGFGASYEFYMPYSDV